MKKKNADVHFSTRDLEAALVWVSCEFPAPICDMLLPMSEIHSSETHPFIEKTIAVQRLHEGRIINLREDTVSLPSGRVGKREIVEHKGAVCIVPVKDDGKIVLVHQFRKATEEVLLELPAGGLNKDEDPQDCAARELIEECGLRATKMTPLFSCFLAPGYSTELIHIFVAEGLEDVGATPEEDENLEIVEHSLDELMAMMDAGKIRDAKTLCGLLAWYRKSRM